MVGKHRGPDKYCKVAKNQMRILEMKYKGNAKIMKVIKSNANDAVTSYAMG